MLHIQEQNYTQTIFQAPPRFAAETGLYIDLFGVFKSDGGFSFRQVAQADAVHAVYAGEGELIHKGRIHPIGPGDLFILRKGELYAYRDQPSNPWNYSYFHLNGGSAGSVLDGIGRTPDRPVVHLPEKSLFWSRLDRLKHQFETDAMTGYSSIISAWELVEQLETVPAAEHSDPAETARRLIDQSPTCITNVDNLAMHLNTDRTTLFRHFKQAYGISVKQYMEKVRFERMEELVRNTALPIGQIAGIGGFSDPLYFSRMFRKRYGVSPRELRNRSRRTHTTEERTTP